MPENVPHALAILFYAIFAVWLGVSAIILWRLGVLRRQPLLVAPQRYNRLDFWHLGASFLVYAAVTILATGILIQTAAGAPATAPAPEPTTTTEPATIPATSTAPSTAPATTAATTTTAPTTLPAATRKVEGLTATQFINAQIGDMLGKALAAALIFFLASRLVKNGLSGFGAAPRQLPRGLLLGLAAILLLIPWLVGVESLSGLIGHSLRHGPVPIHPILQELQNHPTRYAKIVMVLSACVIAPIGEEIFFRGLLQTILLRIARRRPTQEPISATEPPQASPLARWLIIIFVSLLFASIHISLAQDNFEVVPVLFLLALGLGYIYERTGNLWASITLHALFNTSSVLFVLLS